MSWILFLFGSGFAFFLGVGLVEIGLLVCGMNRPKLGTSTGLIGLVMIGLSATPLPVWFYWIATACSSLWLVSDRSQRGGMAKWKLPARIATAFLWAGGVMVELPYQFTAALPAQGSPALYVIADSITAGMDEREAVTWPNLLSKKRDVTVSDYSRMGATAKSAWQQAAKLPDAGGIVLLEIGGNDLLGSTTEAEFERDLDQLLTRVARPDRLLVMFELPLPPLRNEFGRIQRRLAKNHGVLLVPKRILMRVLTAPGATSDSIHLTQSGHDAMADVVWRMIQPAIIPR